MSQESTVEEILANVKRFRILTVGGAGAGKSALINSVFKVTDAKVSAYKTGEANIDREITSEENAYFVGHDSKGFEPAAVDTFEFVRKFIEKRSAPDLELTERLHVVWLCIKIPTAGARVMEAGQEQLLRLVHNRQVPVVVVFTQYDRVLRLKTEQEAQAILKACVDSLKHVCDRLNVDVPSNISVSTRPEKVPDEAIKAGVIPENWDGNISKLVDLTRKIVDERLPGDAWIMWAIAQRKSIPLKIEASLSATMTYYTRALAAGSLPSVPGYGRPLLTKCLLDIHEGIIKCWNFRTDKSEMILSSDNFRQMMLFIAQDIDSEQKFGVASASGPDVNRINQFVTLVSVASASIAPPAAIFGLSYAFFQWLTGVVLGNVPRVQRLLMAYTVDLTLILQNLFEVTLTASHMGKPSWDAVQMAFDTYQGPQPTRPLRGVHDEICSTMVKWGENFNPDIMHGSMQALILKYVPVDK